jgi:hypothetical protein
MPLALPPGTLPRLTSCISPIKITIGLQPGGSGRHDKSKNR